MEGVRVMGNGTEDIRMLCESWADTDIVGEEFFLGRGEEFFLGRELYSEVHE